RKVTVPAAETERSPRASSTTIESPPRSVFGVGFLNLISLEPPTVATLSIPDRIRSGANASIVACEKPPNARGVAIGLKVCPKTGVKLPPKLPPTTESAAVIDENGPVIFRQFASIRSEKLNETRCAPVRGFSAGR